MTVVVRSGNANFFIIFVSIMNTEYLARCIQTLEASEFRLRSAAHDYGEGFAEETLALLPLFIADVRRLETTLRERLGNEQA